MWTFVSFGPLLFAGDTCAPLSSAAVGVLLGPFFFPFPAVAVDVPMNLERPMASRARESHLARR